MGTIARPFLEYTTCVTHIYRVHEVEVLDYSSIGLYAYENFSDNGRASEQTKPRYQLVCRHGV